MQKKKKCSFEKSWRHDAFLVAFTLIGPLNYISGLKQDRLESKFTEATDYCLGWLKVLEMKGVAKNKVRRVQGVEEKRSGFFFWLHFNGRHNIFT